MFPNPLGPRASIYSNDPIQPLPAVTDYIPETLQRTVETGGGDMAVVAVGSSTSIDPFLCVFIFVVVLLALYLMND